MGPMGSDRPHHPLRGGNRFKEHLSHFRGRKVFVLGDLMLDHYIWGGVTRISPEAPVPVVNVTSESLLLGGAANVLHNILTLGGAGRIAGVVGDDEAGRWILDDLKRKGVPTDGIVVDRGRPTTTKTRIIAHSQQAVRFDRERRDPILSRSAATIKEAIRAADAEAFVISDYAKGVITLGLAQEVVRTAARRGVPVIVDPKVLHLARYRGTTLITPNSAEAGLMSGVEIDGDQTLARAGEQLIKRLRCRAVLITRGEHGMTLFEASNGKVETTEIPTEAKQVFDVTGAGDTVVSALALALAAGAGMEEAARIANAAAGIVVGRVGTATVKLEELKAALE